MPRPPKVTSSRSTPRPSTRSQQQSPPVSKPSVIITFKNPSTVASSSRGEVSDNDNDSVCSSSKSSDVILARSSGAKSKVKDDSGAAKAPWRHPDELDYFRPYDWSEDKIISQLRSIVFSVPPPVFGKQSFIEITLYHDGDFDKPRPVKVPRGYRVPLMFVAKFQWASLKLVLTSAQREKEWSDYKFDILHLSRLCQRFFSEAQTACNKGIIEIPPMKTRAPEFQVEPGAMTRKWRCPTFDRALARYNKNWLISREEFLRDFYIEFEDEEYAKDVLKIDWSRWALKGHKGFKLTQDELRCGIDGWMLTRGLKRDSEGKWIWVDEYVIKQEEIAAAVEPVHEVMTLGSSVDKIVTQGDEEVQPTPAPSVEPSQNGHSSAHTDGRLSPELTPLVKPPVEEPVTSTPPHPPHVLELSNHTALVVASEGVTEEATKPPSPEQRLVEKSHSPLSSLLSSASPSVPPPNTSEPQTAGPDTFTGLIIGPRPPSTRLESPVDMGRSSKPSSPPHGPLPDLVISPATAPLQSPPHSQRPTSSSIPPAFSEGTQPPKSPSPPSIPSPEVTSRSIEPAAEISTLKPTNSDTSTSDYSQDLIYEHGVEESKVTPVDQRFSPTSIDSTPTPSPTIVPQGSKEPTCPGMIPATPNTGSSGPHAGATQAAPCGSFTPEPLPDAFWPETPVQDIKPNIADTSSQPTPYWLPSRVPSPLTNQNIATSERNESSKSPQRSRSPVFMSPLLPPTTRSRSTSPDEIPGLGGLSSRHPLGPLPQFVAPTITARTVTEGSSWSIPGSGKELEELEQGKQKTVSVMMKPSDDLAKSIDGNDGANDSNLSIISVPFDYASEFAADGGFPPQSPRVEPTMEPPSSVVHPSPSTPPPTKSQSQSLPRGSDYDDDSDMDFGTPVTSPVIIVPCPKVDTIDMLPPPVSPCPVSIVPKLKDMTSGTKTPRPEAGSGAPNVVTPRAMAPTTATPAVQVSRATTPKPTYSHPIAQQTRRAGLEERDFDSGFPTETHESHIEKDTEIQIPDLHSLQMAMASVSELPAPAQSSAAAQAVQETTIPPLPPISAPTLASTTRVSRIPNSALLSTPVLPTQAPFSTLLPLPSPTSSPAQTSAVPMIEPTSSNPTLATLLKSNATFPPENGVQSPPSRHDQVRNHVQPIEQNISVMQPLPSPTPLRPQVTVLVGATTHPPLQSTPPYEQEPDNAYSPRVHRQINSEMQQSSSQEQFQASLPDSTCRKRQREDESDDEDTEEVAFKSRKRGEGLSIREGGIVVRKVVSMVRDTLTGLNDLLEIAAEQELIPSEKLRGRNKGKANAVEAFGEESPIHTPTTPSPFVQTPIRSRTRADSSEIARLNEELLSMKTEVTQLKDRKVIDIPSEQDHVRAMRLELETLREQIRVLKEAKAPATEPTEVQAMRDEIAFLKNEMRSLQSSSRRSSMAPSTPSTPNLSLRFNNTMTQTIHPLAHLLVEPHSIPPTIINTAIQPETAQPPQSAYSRDSHPHEGGRVEKRPDAPPTTPRSPIIFDDIPLPVKSKRKARMIFSRS